MVTICILDIFLPSLEPICCSMFSSNCCLLTCVRQEASKVVWYSNLFKNFPLCVVIQAVKGIGIANEADADVFLNLLLFLNPGETSESSQFMYR